MACINLVHENIWSDKWRFDDAECQYHERQCMEKAGLGSLATKIAKARQEIQDSLKEGPSKVSTDSSLSSESPKIPSDVTTRLSKLELENSSLIKTVSSLEHLVSSLSKRLESLELKNSSLNAPSSLSHSMQTPAAAAAEEEDNDDDVDLFGSDEEEDDAEAVRVREERLKAYADKKSKKPGPIAKSSVLLDCKPWDDETDMKEMERLVRTLEMDGLTWGAAKLVPLAFGILKLSILCIIEDDKVSVDDLQEKICEFEDMVQSVDIGAFNKI